MEWYLRNVGFPVNGLKLFLMHEGREITSFTRTGFIDVCKTLNVASLNLDVQDWLAGQVDEARIQRERDLDKARKAYDSLIEATERAYHKLEDIKRERDQASERYVDLLGNRGV